MLWHRLNRVIRSSYPPQLQDGGAYPVGSGAHPLVWEHAVQQADWQSIGGKARMDLGVAQQIACTSHVGQRTRFGDSVVEHDPDDHLRHAWMPPGAPPYSWARRCVLEAQDIKRLPALVA
jgi:hypothetical protein